jgi:hypothetical protein
LPRDAGFITPIVTLLPPFRCALFGISSMVLPDGQNALCNFFRHPLVPFQADPRRRPPEIRARISSLVVCEVTGTSGKHARHLGTTVWLATHSSSESNLLCLHFLTEASR